MFEHPHILNCRSGLSR